jgi:transposase-like protein
VTTEPRKGERRQFSREFKLAAIRRMEASGNVKALAAELGVHRKLLCKRCSQAT